jgi:hypothetical protein
VVVEVVLVSRRRTAQAAVQVLVLVRAKLQARLVHRIKAMLGATQARVFRVAAVVVRALSAATVAVQVLLVAQAATVSHRLSQAHRSLGLAVAAARLGIRTR